jgi:ubiquinone/menaquinone biosynthesis C-methylase UbiE
MQNRADLGQSSQIPLVVRIYAAFLRSFFNLLYHQFAWTYDGVAWLVSLGAWQKWVLSIVRNLNEPRILEIGFGIGHLQEALHRKGITPFGLDESRQMGRITQHRLSRLGLYPILVRGNALALPFAECSFHQVVMTFPSETILNRSSLAEIRRVLADNGMVLILPLAWITGRKLLERAIGWLTRVTGESPEWHEQSLEPLKNAGFTVDWEMVDLGSSKVLVVKMVKSVTFGEGLLPL